MLKWIEAVGISIIAVFAPLQAVMLAVGALVIIDCLTGIMAARKLKNPVTSARLRDTVSKFIIYQLAIISAFLVEVYIMHGSLPAVKIIAGAIGLSELKSILENLNIVSGLDIFQELIKKIGSNSDKIQ